MRHSLYHAAQKLLPALPPRAAMLHSQLVEGLARATPVKAEQLIRQHLAPWITALEQAAAEESPNHQEPIRYLRGQSVSLKADD